MDKQIANIVESVADKIPIFSTIKIHEYEIPWLVNFSQMYTFMKNLGMGGLGSVKAYIENQTSSVYAIKEIALIGNEDSNFYKTLLSEVDILKDLTVNNYSRSILKYHDAFMHVNPDGSRYFMIITEYIEGFSLDKIFNDNIQLLTHVILPIGYWLFETLAFMHNLGYVHRDIKPHNIMLDTMNERFVLIDFGLTCSVNKNNQKLLCSNGKFHGTVSYMPPEAFIEPDKPSKYDRIKSMDNIKMIGLSRLKFNDVHDVSPRLEQLKAIDIWAAGITLYVLIENKLPWDDKFDYMIRDKIVGSYEIPYNKSKSIKYILDMCLIRDPSKRSDAEHIRKLIANVIADWRSLSNY